MENKLRVLVVEDKKEEFFKIQDILQPLEFINLSYSEDIPDNIDDDLIIMDYNSVEKIKKLKSSKAKGDVIFIKDNVNSGNMLNLNKANLLLRPIVEENLIDSILNTLLSHLPESYIA